MPNVNLENIVSEWVETYEIDNQRALLILLNFIIRVCTKFHILLKILH
jgi:hypothetical protein